MTKDELALRWIMNITKIVLPTYKSECRKVCDISSESHKEENLYQKQEEDYE